MAATRRNEPHSPNVRMRRGNLEGLPKPDPRVRMATAEDVPAIARVLTAAFGEAWSEEKVRAELLEHPGVPNTFVACVDGQVVGTASYQLKEEFPEAGWVHWVAADPAFLGQGLGRGVTLAVLHAARADGKTSAGLDTQDYRLPAIRTYRGLGFEAELESGERPSD